VKSLRFYPEADVELMSAHAWYRARSSVAAQAFAIEIDGAIKQILHAPSRYALGPRGEHRYVMARFPYTLIYRVRIDHVFITAIAHQSRRPGYWRHRQGSEG
jgi:toxin ParE1/3/4